MIINYDDLKDIRKKYENLRIVLAIGTFDLFHYQHLRYLQDAKKLGDILIVIVKDKSLAQVKGIDRPIIEDYQRVLIIDELKCVDYTILTNSDGVVKKEEFNKFDGHSKKWLESFYGIIERLKPNILYHEHNLKYQPAREYVAKKFCIDLIPRVRTAIVSTTKIINKIRKN